MFNRSDKYVNLRDWSTASATDSTADRFSISQKDIVLSPGEYLVLTSDSAKLTNEYPQGDHKTFLETKIPSLNDDDGSLVLFDKSENVIDDMSYSDDMHSVFLAETEGVSLERINHEENGKSNWMSASELAGFATPGRENSSHRKQIEFEKPITVQPEVFEPGNSVSGFAQIHYDFKNAGLIANVKILDSQGRLIKTLLENSMLASEGFVRWDGDRDNGTKANVGYYLVWFEVFDAAGKTQLFKERVAIATRF